MPASNTVIVVDFWARHTPSAAIAVFTQRNDALEFVSRNASQDAEDHGQTTKEYWDLACSKDTGIFLREEGHEGYSIEYTPLNPGVTNESSDSG